MSPTGGTGTSSTPPRANGPVEGDRKLESTPNSRGASVVSENISLVHLTPMWSLSPVRYLWRNTGTFRMGWWPRYFGERRIALYVHASTFATREALGVLKPTTGSRVLYILVFRKLNPITELHANQLFDLWHQCILYPKFKLEDNCTVYFFLDVPLSAPLRTPQSNCAVSDFPAMTAITDVYKLLDVMKIQFTYYLSILAAAVGVNAASADSCIYRCQGPPHVYCEEGDEIVWDSTLKCNICCAGI
ncbi:uncharacterized protein EDB93DRAFT_1100485 [Suillus bovinus]|uniref:uncharacterized protein n=1 Tax=Suillus bovinus TaxID=48563 RepID=UPI001B861588|nr:uncharacterized protein EDB93DRAFT_1100485 [Suillus bovinus]KAG2158275.1 hypothetical protein EDB93DRAFT_1100485 [Suillus bovinus]